MSKPVTAEEVKATVLAKGLAWIDHHDCGGCGSMVGYSVEGGRLFFNPGCDCRWSPAEPRDWSDAADWINMQSNAEVRNKLRQRFGLPPEAQA